MAGLIVLLILGAIVYVIWLHWADIMHFFHQLFMVVAIGFGGTVFLGLVVWVVPAIMEWRRSKTKEVEVRPVVAPPTQQRDLNAEAAVMNQELGAKVLNALLHKDKMTLDRLLSNAVPNWLELRDSVLYGPAVPDTREVMEAEITTTTEQSVKVTTHQRLVTG